MYEIKITARKGPGENYYWLYIHGGTAVDTMFELFASLERRQGCQIISWDMDKFVVDES